MFCWGNPSVVIARKHSKHNGRPWKMHNTIFFIIFYTPPLSSLKLILERKRQRPRVVIIWRIVVLGLVRVDCDSHALKSQIFVKNVASTHSLQIERSQGQIGVGPKCWWYAMTNGFNFWWVVDNVSTSWLLPDFCKDTYPFSNEI